MASFLPSIYGALNGRLAVVTGAGSGIGRAVCAALAHEGATVVAGDVNLGAAKETVEILKDTHGKWKDDPIYLSAPHIKHEVVHMPVSLDVTSEKSVSAFFEVLRSSFPGVGMHRLGMPPAGSRLKQAENEESSSANSEEGPKTPHFPPTILVNSAGITRDEFLLKMNKQAFQQVLDVNLTGTFLMTQAFSKALVPNPKITEPGLTAAVVNIASVVGQTGNIGQCNYSASKAGVEAMSKTAAKELAKFGIRVNCIAPGFITTPMTNAVPEKVREKIQQLIPMGRFGRPEEIADLAVFLASKRSSYVTGATINANGGFHM